MEKAKRRFFTEDHKRQTVELVRSSGRSIGSVAAEIGLAETVLRKWVNKFGVAGQPAAAARCPLTQAALQRQRPDAGLVHRSDRGVCLRRIP
jgi:transposase